MTERCLLGEKRVLQPCTRLPLFRNLFMFLGPLACGHFGSEVSCGSSMASATSASLRGGEPCSILTQYTFLGSDKFAFCEAAIASWTPMEVNKKQGNSSARAALCLYRLFVT